MAFTTHFHARLYIIAIIIINPSIYRIIIIRITL